MDPPLAAIMNALSPFDTHAERYDAWFSEHQAIYESELQALGVFIPTQGLGLEIGVGTGRFAAPLGVAIGIDPSTAMLAYALARGIRVVQGRGEALPFREAVFDYALLVTVLCFVSDVMAVLAQTRHVLRPAGRLVIGFIDSKSALGQAYVKPQHKSVFYRQATFHAAPVVGRRLADAGFRQAIWMQTLTRPLPEITAPEPVRPGYGQGAFVVVAATA